MILQSLKTMRMLLDIVRQSLSTLWAHKLRSFLTMFGIAWGVGSLLLLVGLGEGFRSGQEKQLATLGQNIMFMFPGRIPAVEGSMQSGQTYHFTYKDYLAIRNEAQFVGALSPVLNREDIRAVSDYGSTNGQVFGVASDYNQIRNVPIGPGRWFNDQDNTERRRVAVVGWELLKNMFPGTPRRGLDHAAERHQLRHHRRGRQGGTRRQQRHQLPHLHSDRNHARPVSADQGKLRGRDLVHQLSARLSKSCTRKRRTRFTGSSPAGTASIPSCKTPSKTGTRSRT